MFWKARSIKYLICLESKVGSGTPLCLIMQTRGSWGNQNNLSIYTVIYIVALHVDNGMYIYGAPSFSVIV